MGRGEVSKRLGSWKIVMWIWSAGASDVDAEAWRGRGERKDRA